MREESNFGVVCGMVMFLKGSFPSLFSFEASKEAWLDDVWVIEGRLVLCNLCFLRYFQDWEMNDVEELLWELHVLGRSDREKDTMVWKASKSGEFLVKTFFCP